MQYSFTMELVGEASLQVLGPSAAGAMAGWIPTIIRELGGPFEDPSEASSEESHSQ